MKCVWAALAAVALLGAADPYCPSYPRSVRQSDQARISLERAAKNFSQRPGRKAVRRFIPSNNFIDDHIFGKMSADGIEPAALTSDAEFLRRVSLDLAGRIPSPEAAAEFIDSQDANKRIALVESLIASRAFVDQFALFYGNMFEVTSGYYNLISVQGRNYFHRYLRDFIENDRSLADVAQELIAASGDSHTMGPVNFLVRGWQNGDPLQDTWDTLTDRVTTRFLGVKTECVSCHDGRRHLEQINLWLTGRRREQFWRQSAFFSRLNMQAFSLDAFNQQMRFLVTDRRTGGYHSIVNPQQPGPRPARSGGPYEPVYIFTGEQPASSRWRAELGRILTADRQFARAAVNYLWAHFFTSGIVDPPDGWDLARVDPSNPPPEPWTLQPANPELLEALAGEFINSNFSVRRIIRLIVESNAYQLSSQYPGEWRPEYARYFARHEPRRLSAEEIYDAMSTATLTLKPMRVEGFDEPVLYANQLPDPTEPRGDGAPGIPQFLANFGRGNWWNVNTTTRPTVLQVLYMMNDSFVNYRTFGRGNPEPSTRVALLMQERISDEDAVKRLYLATLTRYPTESELATLSRHPKPNREQWLSDIQWALLNKLDFLFNF